jgi:hypothetical protein
MLLLFLLPLTVVACSSSATGGDDAGGTVDVDGAAPVGGDDAGASASPDLAPAPLIWPNAEHSANSDPWIPQHHDEITEMHPRTLLLNFANNRAASDVMARWKLMSDAFSEGSRYHGYSDPTAKPFITHEVVKLVDLTDNPVPANWTFPNSTKMPRLNGGIDFAQLYNQTYADYYAIPDPANPSHNLTLCEMLQKGVINDLFIIFNKTGADGNVPEIIEYKQSYDDNDVAIAGQFDPYAGNGAFEPADLPEAKACGISLRVDFIEMTGNISGAMHVLSHNLEHIGERAVPNYAKFYFPLLNRDFDKRFNVSFADWYGISVNGSMTNFITYNDNNSVTWTCPSDSGCVGQSGTMKPFDQGCGNTHYAPNSRNSYDMANPANVLTRCEHYGLHDGPDGKDLQTPFNYTTWAQYAQKYGNDGNGGGWQIYLFQSFPGYHNKATLPDGTKIKNFWPYLYY